MIIVTTLAELMEPQQKKGESEMSWSRKMVLGMLCSLF